MNKTRKYYNKAIECYQKGDIKRALAFCEISISCDLKNKAAIDLKGILYYLKGDITRAKALWRLSDRENNDSVAKKYLEGIENDEERFKLYVKAINLIEKVEIKEAVELLLRCEESDFNSINVNNYLCICYMKTGEFDKAIECTTKVLNIDVKNQMACESRKNLIKYGVIKDKTGYKKVLFSIGIICVVVVLIFSINTIKNIKYNSKAKIVTNAHRTIDKVTKAKVNTKVDSIRPQVQFPTVDFKNVLNNKDFEKVYEYTEKYKNQNLNPSDKVLLTQGINLLTTQGADYFYKNGTNFYNNKDYKNSVGEYLKAYSYGASSYLMPNIIYFVANSYEQLNDYENALKYYGKYDVSYGKGDYEETVLYRMAIMSKDKNKEASKQYARRLVDNYPQSIYNNSNIHLILNNNN